MLVAAGARLLSPPGERGRLSILIFHRVLREPDPLFPEEMHAARFDALLARLTRWFRVLPLADAVTRLRERRLPARALAITFDDGYADNHDVALPLLAKHGASATFFVATGFLDGGRMWNDTIIEAIRRTPLQELDLSSLADGSLGRFRLVDAVDRRRCVDAVIGALKYLEPTRRLEQVRRLAALAGAELPADLMMSAGQVRALHRAGMTIGAHTVNHPILAGLPRDRAWPEIVDGRRRLEDLAGARVGLFAYPNGKPVQDFDDQAVDLVREAGFDAAVTTAWGAARSGDDLLRIPRFSPWDRSPLRYGLRLLHNLATR